MIESKPVLHVSLHYLEIMVSCEFLYISKISVTMIRHERCLFIYSFKDSISGLEPF